MTARNAQKPDLLASIILEKSSSPPDPTTMMDARMRTRGNPIIIPKNIPPPAAFGPLAYRVTSGAIRAPMMKVLMTILAAMPIGMGWAGTAFTASENFISPL
jgi:hypothetical protein